MDDGLSDVEREDACLGIGNRGLVLAAQALCQRLLMVSASVSQKDGAPQDFTL
jgi:hypothetical protein